MFESVVAEEARYHQKLDRLVVRAHGRRVEALEHRGIRLAQLLDDRERALRLLARAVADGTYRPATIEVLRTSVGGKTREIARASAIDLVASGVVADALAEQIEPALSAQLYSYRRGRSAWQAVRRIAQVAREHRRVQPESKKRGLYVLRSDVSSYTDSIPIDHDAILWRELRPLVGEKHFEMVRVMLRPPNRERGVLFGLPTTNVIANLYLTPLDCALEQHGHYARFGDDVIFVHEDPERVREAKATLEKILAERGLRPNEKKLRIYFWNGAPRASLAWAETTPARHIAFLGASIGFDATVALAPDKWRVLLRDVRDRIRRSAKLLEEEKTKKRARVLARIVNAAFDVTSPLSLAHAPMTLDLVSDRGQLAELDYLLALWIAEAASGRRGPRAFREVPYRWLRTEAKLRSRVVARNAPTSSRSSAR